MDEDKTTELRRRLRERYPRVALSHEWLTVPGGSEKVVEAMLDLLPQAEIFTSVHEAGPWGPPIADRPVHTSFLNRLPGAARHYPKLLPLMDRAFRSFDLDGYDLVVSSNHACAKNVRPPVGALHACYCHTPMRYAWEPGHLAGEGLGPLLRLLSPPLLSWLRHVDRRASLGPHLIAANSRFVAQRIQAAWGRKSAVVHPPVEVTRFLEVPRAPEDFLLFFGRVVPYKRADVAVAACRRTGRRLVVAGDGRDLGRVRALADGDPAVTFLGRVPDEEVPGLFARARALIFPGIEDFGIVPVEAQAAGLPVVALGRGGALDSVLDGVTGVLYDEASPAGLIAGLERFDRIELREADLRDHARRFAPDVFAERFGRLLLDASLPA